MGFNWVYLNPVQYPGFSGSLYAIKDYERLNPAFVPPGSQTDRLELLAPVVDGFRRLGLHVMVDLVINHTAKDNPLVEQCPGWYVRDQQGRVQSPFAIDPDDPSKRTVWGDLAEVDNAHASERERLWEFWAHQVRFLLDLGFEGFRCDAAYKVPGALWRYLVDVAERHRPGTRFFAETLGCTVEQVRALRTSGLHFFFNSSKWWDFTAPWCLEQHQEFRDIPSVSFPESHDTERLAAESGGVEAVQRQRYAFAAVFSAGLMMPIGYEFGFRRRLDVVRTGPSDWEEPTFDLRHFIAATNRLKRTCPVFQGEGVLEPVGRLDAPVLMLRRRSELAPRQVALIVLNKAAHAPAQASLEAAIALRHARLLRICRDGAPAEGEAVPEQLSLDPAEVVIALGSEDE